MKLNSIYLKYLYLVVTVWLISCEDSNQDKVEEKAVVPKDTIEKEVFPALGHDAPYITDSTYFGRNNYIEYIAGNIPIILSAPHGGALTPDEIPDRTYGTTVTDANTYQLTKVIMDSMVIRYGGRPHVILCRLKRTKLDANRDSIEAAQNNRFALRAFNEFHFYIDQAKKKIERDFGSGLFFDMHGHGANPDGFYDLRTWLGYLIKGDELDLSDDELKSNVDPNMSSIRALIDSSEFEFVELLRGSSSFGTILTDLGFSCVPSSDHLGPEGSRFFSGGYNTLVHGSKNGGMISAIQIEAPRPGIRENTATWSKFASAFTSTVSKFYKMHLRRDIIAID